MAKRTKKRRYSAAKKTHKRRNPFRMKAKRRSTHRRRNPFVSHSSTPANIAKSVAGGLVGVTLTRMASGVLAGIAPGLTASPIAKAAVSALSAFLVGKIVGGIDRDFGASAAFGGYMIAGSDFLNVFMPNSPFGLSRGMGVWMPSRYAVPENPVIRGQIAAAPAPANGMGMSFAGRRAFA